jgi:hypothetical protein
MKKRSPAAVLLLPFVTFGIYSWYWAVKTKGEMNKQGEQIPTAWIWLIPLVGSIWWYWKYSEGVEHVTKGKMEKIIAFILLMLLGMIGEAIIQDTFNNLDVAVAAANNSPAPAQPEPVAPAVPTPPPADPPATPPVASS